MSTNAMTKRGEQKATHVLLAETKGVFRSFTEAICRGTNVPAMQIEQALLIVAAEKPKLLECSPESWAKAIRIIVHQGLDIAGPRPDAYLIPRKNSALKRVDVSVQHSYRGLIKLGRRSQQIAAWVCREVRNGDQFAIEYADDDKVIHKPSLATDRHKQPITHVYARLNLTNGKVIWRMMTAEEVNEHRDHFSDAYREAESSGRRDSSWHTSWLEMAYKTVLLKQINRGEVPLEREDKSVVMSESLIVDSDYTPTPTQTAPQLPKQTQPAITTQPAAKVADSNDAGDVSEGQAAEADGGSPPEAEAAPSSAGIDGRVQAYFGQLDQSASKDWAFILNEALAEFSDEPELFEEIKDYANQVRESRKKEKGLFDQEGKPVNK